MGLAGKQLVEEGRPGAPKALEHFSHGSTPYPEDLNHA